MKGKATLQVIKDNKVIKEITEENTITNAYKNLLFTNKLNVPCALYEQAANKPLPLNYYSPISKNFFGGILLFTNKKESSNLEDIILPTLSDFQGFIGNAGGGFSGQSKYRGTLNSTESGEITNGYKWVWDFGTDQTFLDGKTINRICLTSRSGGNAGLVKDELDTTRTSIFTSYARVNLNEDEYIGMDTGFNTTNFLIPYLNISKDGYYLCNTSENEFITVKKSSDVSYEYTFKRFRIKSNLSLTDNIFQVINTSSYSSIEELDFVELVETNSFTSTIQKGMVNENFILVNDSDINNIYCLSINYNKTDKLIYYRKFKLSGTFSLIEDTSYTIPADIINNFTYTYNFVEFEGSIYILNYNTHILYKINKDGTYTQYKDIDSNLGYLTVYNNMLCAISHNSFNSSSTISKTTKNKFGVWDGSKFLLNDFYYGNLGNNYKFLYNIQKNIYNNPIILVNGANTNYSSNMNTFPCFEVFSPFFSSINNLSQGIVKEAGSTLKIIYEITN